jgi:hypothetical protein
MSYATAPPRFMPSVLLAVQQLWGIVPVVPYIGADLEGFHLVGNVAVADLVWCPL